MQQSGMTFEQFQRQISKLAKEFGDRNYSQARIGMIWREVHDLSLSSLEQIVDEFVGSLRVAPLLSEFRKAATEERERAYGLQKWQQRQQAEQLMEEIPKYSNEDIHTMSEYIRQRMKGNVTDQDYGAFVKVLNVVSGGSECQAVR